MIYRARLDTAIRSAKNLPRSGPLQPTFYHFIQKDLRRVFVKGFAKLKINLWKSRSAEQEVEVRSAEWEAFPHTDELTYQEQKPGMSQPRGWHKRLLGSPPPTATPNLQLHMERFPLREIRKLAKWFWHMRHMNKHPRLIVDKRLRHTFTINSAPDTAPYNQAGTPTPSLPLESKGFASHIQHPTLRTPTRGMDPPPPQPALKANGMVCPWDS